MKKSHFKYIKILIPALLIGIVVLIFIPFPRSGGVRLSNWEKLAWEDSIKTGEYLNHVLLECDYPNSLPQPVRDRVRTWIITQFGIEDYTSLNNPAELIAKRGKDILEAGINTYDDPLLDSINLNYSIKIHCELDNDEYVTMVADIYDYEGGQHGFYAQYGATFSKSTGDLLSYDELIEGTPLEQLEECLRQGIRQFYQIKDDKQLADNLYTEVADRFSESIPLPSMPPYLSENGLVFIYQLYEIAPFASGMPTITAKIGLGKPKDDKR